MTEWLMGQERLVSATRYGRVRTTAQRQFLMQRNLNDSHAEWLPCQWPHWSYFCSFKNLALTQGAIEWAWASQLFLCAEHASSATVACWFLWKYSAFSMCRFSRWFQSAHWEQLSTCLLFVWGRTEVEYDFRKVSSFNLKFKQTNSLWLLKAT